MGLIILTLLGLKYLPGWVKLVWLFHLHLIQAAMKLNKNLTFHIARHSFATLALAHDVPIENVARMLGHQNIRTTQIYAKVLKSTIERHAVNLQKAIR